MDVEWYSTQVVGTLCDRCLYIMIFITLPAFLLPLSIHKFASMTKYIWLHTFHQATCQISFLLSLRHSCYISHTAVNHRLGVQCLLCNTLHQVPVRAQLLKATIPFALKYVAPRNTWCSIQERISWLTSAGFCVYQQCFNERGHCISWATVGFRPYNQHRLRLMEVIRRCFSECRSNSLVSSYC